MLSDTLKSSVVLVEYINTYEEQLSNFHLPKEQVQFTSMPLDKINDPTISNTAKHVLILENSVPVGYFALEDGELLLKFSTNSNARLLTAFSIDSRNQGKGLAKIGLKLLPEFVRRTRALSPKQKDLIKLSWSQSINTKSVMDVERNSRIADFLLSHADGNGAVVGTFLEISEVCGLSPYKTRRSFNQLSKAGLITRKYGITFINNFPLRRGYTNE